MNWKMADSRMAEAAGRIIARLTDAGHEAYWVGGCIRDELLGRPVHDMDITTSAKPEAVMSLFPRCVPTGLQHGTVTVLEADFPFEVTTYRTESGYADHRRPETVAFVMDVKEDLRRRDFTINAICLGLDGRLIDPFGGAEDLRRRLVRCVGKAEDRFDEDALRMLRCVRFASTLGFGIAKNTWRGLLRRRDGLAHIAVERVYAELTRIMEGPRPLAGLGMLARSGLLARGKAPFPWTGEDLAAAAAGLAGIGELESALLRWALLLHALGATADAADGLMRAWTFPGATRRGVAQVLRVREAWTAAMAAAGPGEGPALGLRRRFLAAALAFGAEAAEGWLALLAAMPRSGPGAGLVPSARRWLDEMPVRGLAGLAVTGGDLAAALDRRPGPWLGELLQALLLEAAAGAVPNDRTALINEAKRMNRREQ
ncbi:tRNA nucleotidyltransferase (CCA-adding enzyme) [Paenibacillus forsythiae]|uniref:tRNA nucleotidyltransferase (CCA-adding enzyme) n=2 Tax=Paenibacillus forsythiae TaxID=365616 RepID=A0ABU3H7K4_9BACL|nr:CCA tRNA nucleotidyltransferase [Paenibacillus forsythiae]MDT3426784.1 tRNA nucleotidyltransferase (CCA-adding enzyme) [Paenibacillus forsythiae]